MPQKSHTWFAHFPASLKYLNHSTMQQMLSFPEDMKAHTKLETNKLNNQALVTYFEEEWEKYIE